MGEAAARAGRRASEHNPCPAHDTARGLLFILGGCARAGACSTGQARSGTEYGPLVDSPDWSYVDTGAAAPQTKAQARRTRQAAAAVVRALSFSLSLSHVHAHAHTHTHRNTCTHASLSLSVSGVVCVNPGRQQRVLRLSLQMVKRHAPQ
jgi:hypothetical protein